MYGSEALQQLRMTAAWMQKLMCLGTHTDLHFNVKLSLKLSDLNENRKDFTIFRKIQFIFQENPLSSSPVIIRLQSECRTERV